MGGAMSNKQGNALSVPAIARGSSPNRQSAAKRVSINPNPVTIPASSSEPLPATTTTAVTAAGTVRGTIPVADSVDPTKVNNVTVSVASEHSYADANKKTDSSSDSSSSTSSSSSSSDDEEDIEKQVEEVLQSITPVSQTATPQHRGRGRPRKNTPSRVPSAAVTPAKRPSEDDEEDKGDNRKKRRGRGCGACPGCVRSDCGNCQYCKDKPKFGGPGKKKQRCSFRVCSNFVSPAGVIRSKACINKPSSPVPIAPKTPQQQTRSTTQAVVAASIRAKIAADTGSSLPVKEIDSAAVTPSAPPPPPPAAPSPLKKQGTAAANKQAATTPGSKHTPGKQATPAAGGKTARGVAVSPAMLLAAAAVTQSNKSSQVERCVSMCVLTSLCLLENFRKSQSATETTASPAGKMMKCCQCGRERKLTIARTDKFCTQRCLKLWEERHPSGDPDTAVPISGSLSSELFLPPPDGPGRQTPRAIKNLHIDMAYPGTVLQHVPPISSNPPTSTTPRPSSAIPPVTTVAATNTPRPITPRPLASSVVRPTTSPRPPVTTVTASIIRTPPSAAAVSLVSTATQVPASAAAVRSGLSNGIKRASQAPPVTPPTKKTKKSYDLPVDVLKWSVRDVGHYFESTVDCRDHSSLLEDQEVDGAALLLITSDTLVKCLSIKLGPALKIMMHVERLKAQQQALS